jgi:hypothetical protein
MLRRVAVIAVSVLATLLLVVSGFSRTQTVVHA